MNKVKAAGRVGVDKAAEIGDAGEKPWTLHRMIGKMC